MLSKGISLNQLSKRTFRKLTRAISRVQHPDQSKEAPPTQIKLLVVDGYDRPGRDSLKKSGMLTAAELFVRMMDQNRPEHSVVQCHLVFPCDSDFKAPDYDLYDGIAWTGSSLSFTEPHLHGVKAVINMAKDIMKTSVPQFGSCYGLQLAGVVFGGSCKQSTQGREMGIGRKVKLTPDGVVHPMFDGKPAVFDAFSSHGDEIFMPPPGMVHLAGNYHSKFQAISIDYNDTSFWSVQYHPEYNLHDMARLTHCRMSLLIDQGFFRDELSALHYIKDLDTLHDDPSRRDVAWRLGIDGTITDPAIRQIEVKNWMKKLVLPVAEDRDQNRTNTMRKIKVDSTAKRQRVAVAFDMDGVLVLGGEVVKEAKSCLKELHKDNIPFIIMTNGGGYLEAEIARQLTKKFEVKITEEQICLAHTPMKSLARVHEHDRILIVGKRYEKLKAIMESYGFQNVITTEEWHANDPSCYSDIAVRPSGLGKNSPVDIIMILNDPIMWGRDLQIVTDAILMSEKKLEVYNSCVDLTFATDFDMPRLGSGSFRVALDKLFLQSTGKELKQYVYGKPHPRTYIYAESMLNYLAERMGQKVPDLIFMVGDNQETDILGANRAGGRWFSILTKGGLYTGGPHKARHLVDNVGEAVSFIRGFSCQGS